MKGLKQMAPKKTTTKKKTTKKKTKPVEKDCENGILELDIEIKSAKQNLTLRKRAMIEALETTMGIVSRASALCGVTRASHYLWLQEDPVYKEAFDDVSEMQLDFGEGALFDKMKEGSTAEIIFFMKCKGKSRGYTEKEIEKPVEVNVNLAVADTSDIARFLGVDEDE